MAKVVILSGAGLSAQSGIKTFRDSGGLWDEYDVSIVCNYDSLEKNESLTLELDDKRRAELETKEPNYAHIKYADLKKRFPKDVAIITQNVDDLFEKAGCKDVLHLHGFLKEVRCEECGYKEDIGYKKLNDALNSCPVCHGKLRPNIVFFAEQAPKYKDLHDELQNCQMLVVIGTSGNVIDTSYLLSFSNIKKSILNNLEPSDAIQTKKFTKVLYKKASDAIDEIANDVDEFLNN